MMLQSNKDKWVKALRSGKFPQTRGLLVREEGCRFSRDTDGTIPPPGFCCLGVYFKAVKGMKEHDATFEGLGDMFGWSAALKKDGLTQADKESLINLNDFDKASFSEIADWIEEHVEVEEEDVKLPPPIPLKKARKLRRRAR